MRPWQNTEWFWHYFTLNRQLNTEENEMTLFDGLSKTGQRLFVAATIVFTTAIAAMLAVQFYKI